MEHGNTAIIPSLSQIAALPTNMTMCAQVEGKGARPRADELQHLRRRTLTAMPAKLGAGTDDEYRLNVSAAFSKGGGEERQYNEALMEAHNGKFQ